MVINFNLICVCRKFLKNYCNICLLKQYDIENYKQIKQDLDQLRLLVEKSELWVFKSKSGGKSDKKKKSKSDLKKGTDKDVNSSKTQEKGKANDNIERDVKLKLHISC